MSLRLAGMLVATAILVFVLVRTAVHAAFLAIAAYNYPMTELVEQPIYLPSEAVSRVRMQLNSAIGDVKLSATDSALVTGTVRYNVAEFAPIILYDVDAGNSQLLMRHTEDVDTIRLLNTEGRINIWDLQVGNLIPIYLFEVFLGSGDLAMDASTLQIDQVHLAVGRGNAILSSSEGHSTIGELMLAAGSGNLTVDLRNTTFYSVEIASGIGDVTVDVSGEPIQHAEIAIERAAGATTVVLPDTVGVRVTVGGLRVNQTVQGLTRIPDEQDEGVDIYVNAAYLDHPVMLDVSIEQAFGTLDLATRAAQRE